MDYYDSEKKWRNGQSPKRFTPPHSTLWFRFITLIVAHRSICVKSCFNVNRQNDCKHKYVVALHLADDCFSIAFDSEQELQKWYNLLLRIQLGDQVTEGEELKPLYGDLISSVSIIIFIFFSE